MIIPHINLGQIGVVGDQNGQALPSNAWTDSLNVRFTPLGLEKIAESTLRIQKNIKFQIFTTKLREGKVYIFAASKGGLHMYDGDQWEFTPAEISDDALWQYTHWGDTVIFNCPDYAPFMFDWGKIEDPTLPSQYFIPLPKWGMISTEWDLTSGQDPSFDTEARCERLIAYKSQLVAVGLRHKEPIEKDIDDGKPDPERDPLYSYKPPTKYSDDSDLKEGDQWYQVVTNDFDYDNPDPEGLALFIWSEDEKWEKFEDDRPKEYEKTDYKDKNNVVWVSNSTSDPTYKVPEGEAGGGADSGLTGLTAGGPPSWDYISPATLSVQQVVGAADGRYIAAEQLNESIIIYTATAAHALIFTGGQYVVQTRRLFMRGAAGPQCVVEFGNNHFVIDGDQLYIHDGSQATRVGEDMFDVEFFKRAVNLRSATLCHDPENREIWIYFDTNYGRKSCIYSYATGTFGWGDGEAKGEPITYSSRGYLPQTGAQWGDMTQPWANFKEPENYWVYPGSFVELDGLPVTDVKVGNTTIDTPSGNPDSTVWKINVEPKDIIKTDPDHWWTFEFSQPNASFADEQRVRLEWNLKTYGNWPVSQGFVGHMWIFELFINNERLDEIRADKNVTKPTFDFFWKSEWGNTPNMKLKVTYPPARFYQENGLNFDYRVLFAGPPLEYQFGSVSPDYQEKTSFRWNDQLTYTLKPKVLALTSFGLHQKEAFFADNRECWVERKAIDLDDAGINGWVIKHLKQYHMQLAGEGKVGIRTGWAESALAEPQWEKPTWLDENGDGSYQADMRTTGRYLSMRFEFKEMGQFRWANGYMDIEVSGRR